MEDKSISKVALLELAVSLKDEGDFWSEEQIIEQWAKENKITLENSVTTTYPKPFN